MEGDRPPCKQNIWKGTTEVSKIASPTLGKDGPTDLIINESGEGKIVKQIGEVSPNICIPILSQAFIVEAVYLRDLARFVITSKDCNAIAVAEFEGNKESNSLDGVVASVDIVTHEEIVGIWRITTDSEEF
jgi:hypothetical protein